MGMDDAYQVRIKAGSMEINSKGMVTQPASKQLYEELHGPLLQFFTFLREIKHV
jgi:hypothetical protein